MASCPIPPANCGYQYFSAKTCNMYTLYGALVGGPDQDDKFKDARDNYQQTEVAIDYNAGYTGGTFLGLLDGDFGIGMRYLMPLPSCRCHHGSRRQIQARGGGEGMMTAATSCAED